MSAPPKKPRRRASRCAEPPRRPPASRPTEGTPPSGPPPDRRSTPPERRSTPASGPLPERQTSERPPTPSPKPPAGPPSARPSTSPPTARPQAQPSGRAELERAIAGLAARQHGVVTRHQLLEVGLSAGAIKRRARVGLLTRMHQGVYLVGAVAPPRAREMAACLACGPTAFLSHWTAAPLSRLTKRESRGPVDLVVTGRRRARPGLRIHRAVTLFDDETMRLEGLPLTTPARTLVDLAPLARPRTLERLVARGLDEGLVTLPELQSLLERHAGRHGLPRLAAILQRGAPDLTRSGGEERFLGLIRSAQLDPPEVNARVAGYEVDFYWPDARLIVEVDGRAFHASPGAFERDRRRDAVLAAAGYRVVRVTWRQLVDEPLALMARLAAALTRARLG